MGAFATLAAAETRAKAGIANGTWINAHAGVTQGGTICVRVQRYLKPYSAGTPTSTGAWVEITDDATA